MLAFQDTFHTAQEVRAAALGVVAFRRAAYAKPAPVEPAPPTVVKFVPSSAMTLRQFIDCVIAESASIHRVTVEDVLGRSKLGPCSAARQAAMAVLRRHTKMSLPHIGRVMQRDHTTVLHACKKSESDWKLQEAVAKLEQAVAKLLALPGEEGVRSMRSDQFTAQIEAFLQASGIDRWHYARRKKHRAVVVEHNGRHTFIFPATSKNWHAPKNMVSIMRRRLGLQRAAP